jgi:hypothetical protein
MKQAKVFSQLSRTVGKGFPPRSVLISSVLVLILFFYVFALGSYFKIGVFRLENRASLFASFDFHVINENVDNIIIAAGLVILHALYFGGRLRIVAPIIFGAMIGAIGSLNQAFLTPILLLTTPTMVLLFLFYKKFPSEEWNKVRNMIFTLSRNYFAITIILLSIVSIIISFAPFSQLLRTTERVSPAHDYAYNIFILFSTFSSFILLLLIGCFPVKMLMSELLTRISRGGTNIYTTTHEIRRHTNLKIVCLAIFMTLAALLVLIPHQPFNNKLDQDIGVDTKYYVKWVNDLRKSTNIQEFMHKAFVVNSNGDRPVSLMLLFAVGEITGSDLTFTFEHLPVILGPTLVLVIFFLTRALTSDDTSALMASFLTAISFQVLIGIYAGLYANWIALIFGYSAVLFLVRFLKNSDKRNLIAYSALMLLLLLSHSYTWTVLTIIMTVFLLIMLRFNNYPRTRIFLLLMVISSLVAIDISKMQITNSPGGIERDLQIAGKTVGIDQFSIRWENLEYAIHRVVGGQFSNFIIFSLALYWLYKCDWRAPSTILIMVFLSIGILPFLFGDGVVQTRVYYDIPFQIPAGIALALIIKNGGTLLSLSICGWLVAISVNSVLNFFVFLEDIV